MEGRKKERVMAAAVCVLVLLLSAQRLPVADAMPSEFCQCYADRYQECGEYLNGQGCKAYCCERCAFPGDGDFDRVCGASGGEQAPFCSTEEGSIGGDTTSTTTTEDSHHGKAKAKHG